MGIAYSTTQYIIPEARISLLEEKMFKVKTEYELLKSEVEKLIPDDFDLTRTSWNLDFATHTVVVSGE